MSDLDDLAREVRDHCEGCAALAWISAQPIVPGEPKIKLTVELRDAGSGMTLTRRTYVSPTPRIDEVLAWPNAAPEGIGYARLEDLRLTVIAARE
jgi:hypothetical protein